MDTTQYNEKQIMEKYYLYKTMLFRIAFSYLRNRHDCEDIIQEAFIKLCYHAPSFDSTDDEKRWVIRITINLCKNHLRVFWNRNRSDIEELKDFVSEENDQSVLSEILNLPVKYKTTLILHYIEGYKVSELSKIFRISESAIKMRLKRGRELLKLELEDES